MRDCQLQPIPGQQLITFTKVNQQWGWLGNMSPHPITIAGKHWRTAEAFFQGLRFPEDSFVRELIRSQKSPMSAKMMAKKHKALRIVEPQSDEDVNNMRFVLRLKLDQNGTELEIAQELQILQRFDNPLIVEDCSKRARGSGLFWGAALVDADTNRWCGQNILGRLWMECL